MDNKSYFKLEFNIIRERLSERAVTEPAKKRALELEPYEDAAELINALKETSDAQSLIMRRSNPPISSLGDVLVHIKRLNISAILREKELLEIASLLMTSRRLKEYASEDGELGVYFDSLTPVKFLEDEITSKIISEDEIADSASVKLMTVRKKIRAAHEKIREILNKYITSAEYQKYLQDNIITIRGDRFVIPVKAENKSSIPGIVHDSSSSGSTVFIEPMAAVNANNEIKELHSEELQEIERILYDLTAKAAEYSEVIKSNYETICELDLIFARAKLGISMKGTVPKINTNGNLKLKKARHPLIDPSVVVPVNIELGGEFDSLIITGPNTGGKTVTLKTTGLCCLMGLSGMMIPAADNSEIPFYRDIFADIGDEQSISQSLSTFSSHMKNIVHITDNAGPDTLVLLDELGAGTDPVEGASLAIGIIEYLREAGCAVMATTHYSELKMYALSTKGVRNAGCEFDIETLKPTYRLIVGIPGKSNAFAISGKLGIREEILEKAKAHMNEDEIRFEDVLGEIEKSKKLLEEEQNQTLKYKNEINELKEKLAEQKLKNEEKYARILEKANKEAKEILEAAKESADEAIKEIRKLRKTQSQKEFDRAASGLKESLSAKIRTRSKEAGKSGTKGYSAPSPDKLIPGTTVILMEHDQEATVMTPPDKDGNMTVMAGILKINVNIKNVALGDAAKESKKSYVSFQRNVTESGRGATELDLRGKTVLDAVMDAEKFIDDAVMLHLERVCIIHGKGTGALRAAIHDMLKSNKNVKTFRLGKYGEGEDGVTIVELK